MPPVLQIKNLYVSFKQNGVSTPIIKDISFSIEPGETRALLGESGSGKSLTAASILQLLPSTAQVNGSILFTKTGSESIDLLKADEKTIQSIRGRYISMIFQEPMTSLNPLMTCGMQVAEAYLTHMDANKKEAKAKTIEWFTRMELPEPEKLYDKYPHQLSGGQKQRVMIAMAMVTSPQLLIADEPTTALDVSVQREIMVLLQKLKQEWELSILLITHDLGLVSDYADTVSLLQNGSIVEEGPALITLQQPSHPYTKKLVDCSTYNNIKHQINASASSNEKSHHTNIQPILEVSGLTLSYFSTKGFTKQKIRALTNISFEIYEGEIIGVAGESGSGKSTLGKCLLQLLTPESGSIKLKGRDITERKNKKGRLKARELQIVFQDPYGSLNPRLSIGEAIDEVIRVNTPECPLPERKRKIQVLLESVHLSEDHRNRYPHQFSGGQRQRICIARALATEPSFIVFDESVSALDATVQRQIVDLISELRKSLQLTILFISHDLNLVRQLCDRVIIMHKGEIVEAGTTEAVFSNPANAYTRKLLEAIPGKTLSSY